MTQKASSSTRRGPAVPQKASAAALLQQDPSPNSAGDGACCVIHDARSGVAGAMRVAEGANSVTVSA